MLPGNHTIVFTIGKDGKITSQVQGVAGPACKQIETLLAMLGKIEEATPTDDFFKDADQGITLTTGE